MAKEFRELRQKAYDVSKLEFVPWELNGKYYEVYSNFNFSIMIDDFCNADCSFCVAALRFENQGQQFKKTRITDDAVYLARLEEVLKVIRPLNPSVSITGGEPSKCSRLVAVMKLLYKYGFRKKTITTNASGLLSFAGSKRVIDHVIDCKYDHLNISRAHYDEAHNASIMRWKTGGTSNWTLQQVFSELKYTCVAPRMSCLLLQEGIRTIDQILEYVEFYSTIGCKTFIFRELMDYNADSMSNADKIHYCATNKVYLNDVWPLMDADPRFERVTDILGYYYYVEVFRVGDCTVVSESADLKQLYIQKAANPGKVFEMVYHPNGFLNGGWVDNEDVLWEF